ncbi:hypothetical protein Tco_0431039 [Tanacetum coccineum]
MARLPPRAQRHLWLMYEVEGYTEEIVQDYEQRLDTIFSRQVNRVHILDFARMTVEMRQALTDRLRMMYTRVEGQVLFTSDAWKRLFEIRGPLVHEFMLEFFSTCMIYDTKMGLDVHDTLCFQLGGARRSMILRQFILALGLYTTEEMAGDGFEAYWVGSLREIANKGDLSDYRARISSDGDFVRVVPSYTSIRDLLRRLGHRLIAVSISSRGQTPEKVTATNLFYLRSMDDGTSINIPYLLAYYLFRHNEGRKRGLDTVMSDYEDSMVTYTVVSSPFVDLPNIGSPGVDGPPVMPEDPYAYVVSAFQALPSPDYVPGSEYPPSPEFVPEPVYPKFMPPEDEILPAEEQPLPAAVSPTADSLSYVSESDPEEDPKEDDDKDPKEDPADYPADGRDDGDDEDKSSDDDEDEDVDIEEDGEEEEHPAPVNSTAVALPAVDLAPSAEETEPFETDESAATPPPHPAYCVTARISIKDETPISLPYREEVERLLAMPTPPSSPLSSWSSLLPQIPSLPLPSILSPLPVSPPLP